jgi:RNA polymerase sigma-54 factor
MNLDNGLYLEQSLSLSMYQIQSLEILAMDTQELRNLLKDEYLENPMFDYHGESGAQPREMMTYQKNYQDAMNDKDKFLSNIPMPEEGKIREYLLGQLPQHTSRQDEKLAEYMIDCLDDEGFLTISVDEIAKGAERSPEDVKRMLAILTEMEPHGIFQADRRHCLMKQMELDGRSDSRAYRILRDYYTELLNGKISVITRGMKVTTAEVRKCIEEIAELNPHPLQGFDIGESHYIEPDIIAEREHGVWTVRLNDDWVEDYGISDYYVSMMQTTKDPELLEYFGKKLERARLLISNIAQRRKTIERVVRQILKSQPGFFEGHGPLLPMTMSELAEQLEISPSTVSRALRGKYLQFPGGTVLLKDLFSVSVSRVQGREGEINISASMIQQRMKELIQTEDRTHPLSDQAIAERLKAEGIRISRRAVAKYREELGIRSSFERKS